MCAMNLTTDAQVDNLLRIKLKNIDKDMLKHMENDLEMYEKVSLTFLLAEDMAEAYTTACKICNDINSGKYYLCEFIETLSKGWSIKLLEALCIIKTKHIIERLGYSYAELEKYFSPDIEYYTHRINKLIKLLFILCEYLNEKQTELLLRYMKEDGIHMTDELKDMQLLEVHILYWAKSGYISISSDGTGNVQNLKKHLKRLPTMNLSLYEEIDKLNISDTGEASCYDNALCKVFDLSENKVKKTADTNIIQTTETTAVNIIKKGICVIINEIHFPNTQYETRLSSIHDEKRLKETFMLFGFQVLVFNDLSEKTIIQRLQNITNNITDESCVIVCILSHGVEGAIVTTNGKILTLKELEMTLCCEKLKYIKKILIVQACQGKTIGRVKDTLTTDGPENVVVYGEFFLFTSTMPGFVSVRDKQKGSWFIQVLCDTLIEGAESNETFCNCAMKTTNKLSEMRGIVNGVETTQIPQNTSLFPNFQ
ncbi:caspase-8 isoform X2 [Cephus cinctus]|uniref:Caspase-8 isoform X2 n=1 Tax=Cephus cinctus TaxID=211228 RepID=A0AAJ7W706_CEPCN|nr:caspase-8 isoform X2 [Cephus cinctus]